MRYDAERVADIGVARLARRRAVLSQHVELAFPLAVEDVVLMGRYPHYGRVPSARDREIVERGAGARGDGRHDGAVVSDALGRRAAEGAARARAGADLDRRRRPAARQYLFLDEPTSNLDVHYELHLLDVAPATARTDCTVVAILHDLNLAFRYGDAFFVLEHGHLAQEADRAEDIERTLIERVFRVRAIRIADPVSGEGFWRFSSAGKTDGKPPGDADRMA